jgi:hypothetical protein
MAGHGRRTIHYILRECVLLLQGMKKDKFENIKGIIRNGKSNDKLYNVQKNKDKHDLQHITQKTID